MQFNNVHKIFYQDKTPKLILNGVSFECKDGAITGLLGPNGAGKTTLIKILAGMIKPDNGSVTFTNSQTTLPSIGVFTDGFGLYPKLSALENIRYFADLNGCDEASFNQQLRLLSHSLNLETLLNKRISHLSQGEKMRVGLARTLIHNPKYIILDEPTNGLDVMSVIHLRQFLKKLILPEYGSKCILYASHVMSEVEKLADHIVIIKDGNLLAQGSKQTILDVANTQDFETAFLKIIKLI